MTQNVLIIGATSSIAEAVARRYAAQGARLFLVARNQAKLQAVAADLSARGAKNVYPFEMDANDRGRIPALLAAVGESLGKVDVALIAHGTLPEQARTENDIDYAVAEFRTNAESVITCLAALGKMFAEQRAGVIAVIGSVAGDRGRSSNYLYGAAKAAIDTYASGLRAKLFKYNVHVLAIKPGFVATAMTAHLNLPARLTAAPDDVAVDICSAIQKRKDTLYTPWFWKYIMFIIRYLPMAIFKRTSL